MKQRAHVLHKQVKGFVQRKNMTVLKDELPSKCVYVISVRLSNLQRKLYTQFLHSHGLLSNPLENNGRRSILFNAYHALAKIWNHPDLLLLAQEEKDSRKEDNLENFTVDTDEDIPNDVETCLDESPRGDLLLHLSFFQVSGFTITGELVYLLLLPHVQQQQDSAT
jgi:transcriptional regulator ATRX